MGISTRVMFVEVHGGYIGRGSNGRRWRITEAPHGWLLEFRDDGDTAPTNAGVHGTVAAAAAAAGTGSGVADSSRSSRTTHLAEELSGPRSRHYRR